MAHRQKLGDVLSICELDSGRNRRIVDRGNLLRGKLFPIPRQHPVAKRTDPRGVNFPSERGLVDGSLTHTNVAMSNPGSALQEKLPCLIEGNQELVTSERAKVFHFLPHWYKLETATDRLRIASG